MPCEVVFIHPDLGIGGAERAVIDAALSLKSQGYSVQFVTAHHDPGHCFEETRNGKLKVTCVGDWLPRAILRRCQALCAYVRMIYAAIYLVFFSGFKPDVIFCDQISACLPVLRLSRARVLFYCHYPDLLLTQRHGLLKRVYRAPLDWLEEYTTGLAHCVLVNSNYTAGIFTKTFPSLRHIKPAVLYPIPDFSSFDGPAEQLTQDLLPTNAKVVFLSINRYERKKNIGLAVKALDKLREVLGSLDDIHLVITGGYDSRVVENKEHYLELKSLAESLKLEDHVTFYQSCSDSKKRALLRRSTCLLYTPDNEHFGIVPIEAMYLGCPVVAVGSGGPLETVKHNVTGFHCEPNPESFCEGMLEFVRDKKLKEVMGTNGRKHVTTKFSSEAFTNQLHAIIERLCKK